MHQIRLNQHYEGGNLDKDYALDGISIDATRNSLLSSIKEIEKYAGVSFNFEETRVVREGHDSRVYRLVDVHGDPWVLKEYEVFANKNKLSAEQTRNVINFYVRDTQKLSSQQDQVKVSLDFSLDNTPLTAHVNFVSHPEPFIANNIVYTLSRSWVSGATLWDLIQDNSSSECKIYDKSSKQSFNASFHERGTLFINPLFEICQSVAKITGRNYEVVYRNIKPQLDLENNQFILIVTDPANKIDEPLKEQILFEKFFKT